MNPLFLKQNTVSLEKILKMKYLITLNFSYI